MSNIAAERPESEVDGGPEQRTDLEPEQGSLALSAPQDTHDRAEWEAAAAAVLRKARRLADDDPNDLVWSALTRTTLDGVEVTPSARRATSRPARRAGARSAPAPGTCARSSAPTPPTRPPGTTRPSPTSRAASPHCGCA